MRFFLPLTLVLLGLCLLGLGFYALIGGQLYLIRGTLRGPLARVVGIVLIVFTIVCLPVLLRGLLGLGMHLGR
jgi:hypothetical protein